MKSTCKFLTLLLALLMLVACMGALAETPDTSEYVELRLFAIADAPNDAELGAKFLEELNAKLKEELNCTIKYEYASGNNYTNNYQLALASGEEYDLIQSASWLDYPTFALKGAYMDLKDLLPVYAPNVWALISDEKWSEVSVNGAIYGIPANNNKPSTQTTFMYREDLRKKYNLPEITDFDTIAAYLQGIKDNEPDLLPSNDYQSQVWGTMFIPSTGYQIVDTMGDMHCNFVIDPANPREVRCVAKTPEYLPFIKMMKDWSDRGFWPKSVLSNMDWGVFSVMNGKAAASFNEQFPGYAYHAVQIPEENPGWEIGFFLFSDLNEHSAVLRPSATGNMLSVARTAKNPERALMVVDYLMTQSEELNHFINYGYEGVNYVMTDDGKIDTSGISQDKLYNYFPGSLFFNDAFEIIPANRWERYDEYIEKVEAKYVTNHLAGFTLDVSAVEVEYNAVNQVRTQYGFPLQVGLIDDVDAGYADYIERLDNAGIEKVRAEIERQINEYLDAK